MRTVRERHSATVDRAILHYPLGEEALHTDPAIFDRRVRNVCERLGFVRRRILDWRVAQSVLSALQHIEEDDDGPHISANVDLTRASKRLAAMHNKRMTHDNARALL